MVIDSYFNRDREDDDELSSREKDLLNFPPPRFYDPREGPFSEWNVRQKEYGMLQIKLSEKRRERDEEIIRKMKNPLDKIDPDFRDG